MIPRGTSTSLPAVWSRPIYSTGPLDFVRLYTPIKLITGAAIVAALSFHINTLLTGRYNGVLAIVVLFTLIAWFAFRISQDPHFVEIAEESIGSRIGERIAAWRAGEKWVKGEWEV